MRFLWQNSSSQVSCIIDAKSDAKLTALKNIWQIKPITSRIIIKLDIVLK